MEPCAPVAQWIEHWFPVPGVVGSTPIGRTILENSTPKRDLQANRYQPLVSSEKVLILFRSRSSRWTGIPYLISL